MSLLFDDNYELSKEMMVVESNASVAGGAFHRELTEVFDWIRAYSNPRRLLRDREAKEKIIQVIKKHSNISVNIRSDYQVFAMMPPDLNKNHTLIDHDMRHWYDNKEVMRRQGELKASVDLRRFRVGGDFANVVVDLFLDPALVFAPAMTAGMLSAITLHEVGHMFSFFALAAHTYSINLPMLGAINRIANSESTEQVQIILKEWNMRDEVLTKVDVKELSGKKKEVIVTALISNQVVDTKSLMKQREYEEVNTEHLADKFAVRCGAGGDLAAGLDFLMAMYGSRQRGFGNFILNEIQLIIMTIVFGAATILTAPMIIPLIIFVPILIAILTEGFSNAGDGTYDTEINRFGRMRDDMVNMLKDPRIDKAIGQRIRADIRRIDDILKNYKDYRSLIGRFFDFIVPSKRRLLSQTEFYRELEKLSSNDLFVAAYDLRNL